MSSTNQTPERQNRPASRKPQTGKGSPSSGNRGNTNHPAKRRGAGGLVAYGVKGTLSIIGKTILTLFLIGVITGSIVASVLTIYVVDAIDNQEPLDLRDLKLNYTTTMYATDENGEAYPLQVMKSTDNRIWINFNDIPEQMQIAAIAAEDMRFQAHQGVDWKMTFKAFLNMLTGGDLTGGSTITQQLIKNVTNDKDVRIDRKLREIFRALALEKEYSKDDIIEGYLNTITLGNGTYGIQAAANLYFGKNVQDLDEAECAAIIAITQNPSIRELFNHEDRNKERRDWILSQMCEYELTFLEAQYKGETKCEYGPVEDTAKLTEAEYKAKKKEIEDRYDAAKKQKLVIQSNAAQQTRYETYSYFVDYVIEEVIADLMKQYNYEYNKAWDMVYNGGLSIYTTVDERIQNILDEDFITNEINYDPKTSVFPHVTGKLINSAGNDYAGTVADDEQPQCSMLIMDYQGNIKGIAGGRGEKVGDRTFNLATDGLRQTGSSIKPISVYAPAIDLDLVHWSYMTEDSPYLYKKGDKLVTAEEAGVVTPETAAEVDEDGNVIEQPQTETTNKYANGWPINYYLGYKGILTVDRAIQNSVNTIAVKTLAKLTPEVSYDFLVNNLGITSLLPSDKDLAPLALGAQGKGISMLEMTAAYQIFGNGGIYYEPHSYTRVVDNQGNVLLEPDTTGRRVISEDTACVMNKLLQSVVTGGTGSSASLGQAMPVIGKTGTSSLDKDQWFMGGTPYYVAGVWYGYDKINAGIPHYSSYPPPVIWKNIMSQVSEGMERAEFPVSDGVVQRAYCTVSGDLATDSCPGKATGWYKESALPNMCTEHGNTVDAEETDW